MGLIQAVGQTAADLAQETDQAGFAGSARLPSPCARRANGFSRIYRSYTFKKLQGDTAMVGWDFRYTAADKKSSDTSDVLNNIPVSGKGSGSALLDLRNHCILRAAMDFAAPVATVGDVSVTWIEKAVFSLVDCR